MPQARGPKSSLLRQRMSCCSSPPTLILQLRDNQNADEETPGRYKDGWYDVDTSTASGVKEVLSKDEHLIGVECKDKLRLEWHLDTLNVQLQ